MREVTCDCVVPGQVSVSVADELFDQSLTQAAWSVYKLSNELKLIFT